MGKVLFFIALFWFIFFVANTFLALNGIAPSLPLCLMKFEPQNYVPPLFDITNPCDQTTIYFTYLPFLPAIFITYLLTRDFQSLKKIFFIFGVWLAVFYGIRIGQMVILRDYTLQCKIAEQEVSRSNGFIDGYSDDVKNVKDRVQNCRKNTKNISNITFIVSAIILLACYKKRFVFNKSKKTSKRLK